MASRRANNEGSVYTTKDGRFRAYLDVDGHRKYLSGTSEADVLRKLQAARQQAARGELALGPDPRVADWLQEWLDTVVPMNRRPSTRRAYVTGLNRINPLIGTHRLSDLAKRPLLIQRAVTELSGRYKPATVRASVAPLHAALEHAVRVGLLTRNPTVGLTLPSLQPEERTGLSLSDFHRLLVSSRGTRYAALWAVLGGCGLRIGEAMALRWIEDVRGAWLAVDRTLSYSKAGGYQFGPTKTGRRRTVRMPAFVTSALGEHAELQADERRHYVEDLGLVFPNLAGRPQHTAIPHHHLTKTLRALGIPAIRVHDLRHTYVSLQQRAGTSMLTVSRLVDHRSLAMTDHYSHVDRAMYEDAADRLDRLLRDDTH